MGRPIASLLHLGAAAAICSPLLACAAVSAVVPDIGLAELAFAYPASGSLRLGLMHTSARALEPAMLPHLAGQVCDIALDRLLATFSTALTSSVALPEPTLTGNVMSALTTAARLITPAPASYRARALVELMARRTPWLREAGSYHWREPDGRAYFHRHNCCLYYQLPGGGICGDCVLAS